MLHHALFCNQVQAADELATPANIIAGDKYVGRYLMNKYDESIEQQEEMRAKVNKRQSKYNPGIWQSFSATALTTDANYPDKMIEDTQRPKTL